MKTKFRIKQDAEYVKPHVQVKKFLFWQDAVELEIRSYENQHQLYLCSEPKYFDSIDEAKTWAEKLIKMQETKEKYRGQRIRCFDGFWFSASDLRHRIHYVAGSGKYVGRTEAFENKEELLKKIDSDLDFDKPRIINL